MKILVKGKVEKVSLDRVKPAHLDNEPAIGTEKQRKTQTNTKNSKKYCDSSKGACSQTEFRKEESWTESENTATVCGGSTWYEFGYNFTA